MEILVGATTLSIAFGLMIEMFFRLIKYKDSLNSKHPVPITAYGEIVDASNYMSVSQYLSGGKRRWANYFLFRLLPPVVILILLTGVLNRYFNIYNPTSFVLLAAVVSLLMRDLYQIFKADLISERLLHVTNTLGVLLVSYGVVTTSRFIDLSFLAPSIDGLIDNLWSSLLVAMLVILYFHITNMGKSASNRQAEDLAITNYVLSSKKSIEDRFSSNIVDACRKYECSIPLLYSILIYENMNRPNWLRFIENALNTFPGVSLTVGIAQVKSKKSLTDKESILIAANVLKNTSVTTLDNKTEYQKVIRRYNNGSKYADSVYVILENLRYYSSDLFTL